MAALDFLIPLGNKGIMRELTKDRGPKKFSTQSEGQQDIMGLIQQGLQGQGPFASLGQYSPEASAQQFQRGVADPLINQFQEEILPGITGQFRGQGLQNSTFAAQGAARAGEGLERQLASGLAQYQSQQEQNKAANLQNLLNLFMGTQTFGFKDEVPNYLTQLGTGFIKGAGQAAGAALGGGF